jgi:hypothetical protein
MGRLSLEEVKQLARQLAGGLHAAHCRGVFHRPRDTRCPPQRLRICLLCHGRSPGRETH